jgi:hypothetical protein
LNELEEAGAEHAISRPDWLLFGARMGGACVAFGSTEVTQIEVSFIYEDDGWMDTMFGTVCRVRSGVARVQVGGSMRNIAWATGATYGEAVKTLFESWDPDLFEKPELPRA